MGDRDRDRARITDRKEARPLSSSKYKPTTLELARDELFSHIQRCGVLEAEDSERGEWMKDTVEYLGERYPDLNEEQLAELSAIGHRYCQPAIPHGSNGSLEETAEGTADEIVEEVANETAEETVAEIAEETVEEVANETAEEIVEEVAKETAEEIVEEVAKETAEA
jgi:hypothetical protein